MSSILARTKIATGLLCIASSNYAASPLSDTTSASPSLADIPLEQLMELPVEFVTGASKYEQSIRRAPASVTVFRSEDIQNYGWRTLSDALRSAPGFHIRNDRFYDYVGNRGFTRAYDYNSRTLILVNGHRINDAVYQQGSIGTDFILDLDLIDRIEIIRGPSSSLYGSSAFYGAINIIPKKGREIGGAQSSLSVSSEPSGKARFTVGNRTANGVEYLISGTEWRSDGERDFTLPQSWRDSTGLTDKKVTDQDGLHHQSLYSNVSWKGIEFESAYVKRRKDVPPPVYFTNTTDPAYGIDERGYALGRLKGDPTASSTLSAEMGFDYYTYEGLFSPSDAGFDQIVPQSKSLSLNGEVRWQQELPGDHILIAGLEYQTNIVQRSRLTNITTSTLLNNVDEKSSYVSPFAQLDWNITRRLLLSTGARYDNYSTGEKRLNPRVGLIWEASDATTVKLLYGQAFRVPNLAERYGEELGLTPNPNLGPETNQSWEFMVDHKLNSTWTTDVHLYRNEASDLIISDTVLSGINAQEITAEGIETGLTAYFTNNIQVRTSCTFQSVTDSQTSSPYDAPEALFKLNASAPLGVRWLRLSGEIQYVSSRNDANSADVDDYITSNLTLRAIQLGHRWDVSLSVYNLFNSRWSDPTNDSRIRTAPRTFVARVGLDF